MQILLVSLAALVAAAQTPAVNQKLTRSESVMVRAVIDGETIEVATIGRQRLLGVAAPGKGESFAREARERLAALVLRRWVHLEYEGSALAAGGRRSAYVVRDDGLFVNLALVREGLARVNAARRFARLAELERAEAEARSSRRGIWGGAPQTPGTSYTHRSNRERTPSTRHGNAPKTDPKNPYRP
jgi:micrococcal nuclease